MQEDMFPVVVQAVAGEDFTVFAYMLENILLIKAVSGKN